MPRVPIALVLAAILSPLGAQSVVVPNANANARGTSQLNTLVRNSANPRTYMQCVNASQLGGIPVGALINGVSTRFQIFASNSATWPPANVQWTDYQIWVGPANPATSWTGNFLANFASAPVQVRSGPMLLTAGTYTNTSPAAPLPNAWGEFYFDFQTPFVYPGGDLALLFTHPGSTTAATAQYMDVLASSAPAHGVAFTQSVYPTGSAGISTNYHIMRIHYGYGGGCAGTNGFAMLVQNENVSSNLGGTLRFSIGNGQGNALAAYVFGAGVINLPLPNGCPLLTTPILSILTFLDANGRAVHLIPVAPGTLGAIEVQGLCQDPNGPMGYVSTNGVQVVVN